MRSLLRVKRLTTEAGIKEPGIYRGSLAEDYDGIGLYVMVDLAHSSVSAAYKARIAAGDFNGQRTFPRGTPVVVQSDHGQLEVLSLGNNLDLCAKSDEPPKVLSFLIPPGTAGDSEVYYGDVGDDGSLYVQILDGDPTIYDPSGTTLAKFDVNGDLIWAVDNDFILADPIIWFDGFIYQSSQQGSTVHITKRNAEDGSLVWLTTVVAPSSIGASQQLDVNAQGGVWLLYRRGATGHFYLAILDADGNILTSAQDLGVGPLLSYYIKADVDRTSALIAAPSFTYQKVDMSGNPVAGFTAPPQIVDQFPVWGATEDGGWWVWFGGQQTFGPGSYVWVVEPAVIKYSADGTVEWTSKSSPYLWNDSVENDAIEICGKLFMFGVDQVNYFAAPDHFMYTGLLVLDMTDGSFISYQQLNNDPGGGPLGQYLDTYLHAAGYGWMWVGGANYSDSYDGIPMDPTVADYGFISLLKLRS